MKDSDAIPQHKRIAMGGGEDKAQPVTRSKNFAKGGGVHPAGHQPFKDKTYRESGAARAGYGKGVKHK